MKILSILLLCGTIHALALDYSFAPNCPAEYRRDVEKILGGKPIKFGDPTPGVLQFYWAEDAFDPTGMPRNNYIHGEIANGDSIAIWIYEDRDFNTVAITCTADQWAWLKKHHPDALEEDIDLATGE